MAKLTLNTIGSRYGSIDALNDNSDLIEAAFENTLSRDGTGPNNMESDLDMDSNSILNTDTVFADKLRTDELYISNNLVVSAQLAQATNASVVQYTPEGTGALATTVQSKLRETVSVKDFGAVGDGVTDDTAAIQAAVNTGVKAIVPPGTYLVTSTILIAANKHLHVTSGATITKATGTTQPVVRISGNNASLTGEGPRSIISTTDVTGNPSDPTTEGIVNVGPSTLASGANINWSRVSNLTLVGSSTRWSAYQSDSDDNEIDSDIGLKLVNSANFNALSGSLYNSLFDKLVFSNLGIGVDAEPVVQGNNFDNLYFFRCTYAGLRFKGCNENSLNQTFFHNSQGITYVRLERSLTSAQATAAGFSYYDFDDRACSDNQFVNLLGEPGADGPAPEERFSRVFNLGVGMADNYFQGNRNTGHGDVNNSGNKSNIFIFDGTIVGGDLSPNSVAAGVGGLSATDGDTILSGTSSKLDAYGQRFNRVGRWSLAAGATKKLLTIQLTQTSVAADVELIAVHGWSSSSTSSWGSSKIHLSLDRGNTTDVRARILTAEHNQTTTKFRAVEVAGDTCTVAFTAQHDLDVVIFARIASSRTNSATGDLVGITVTALPGTVDSTAAALPTGVAAGLTFGPTSDNTLSLGSASFRWSTVFAATGTINTSDGRTKQKVADLTEAERQVAQAIKGLIKTFQFNDAVEAKGDKARIHVGVIAQDVQQAFTDAGLDAARYALFCLDVWHTYNGNVVEVDADGKYTSVHWIINGQKAVPDEEGNFPEGAVRVETKHDTERQERMGIRYDQLLAFVLAVI